MDPRGLHVDPGVTYLVTARVSRCHYTPGSIGTSRNAIPAHRITRGINLKRPLPSLNNADNETHTHTLYLFSRTVVVAAEEKRDLRASTENRTPSTRKHTNPLFTRTIELDSLHCRNWEGIKCLIIDFIRFTNPILNDKFIYNVKPENFIINIFFSFNSRKERK